MTLIYCSNIYTNGLPIHKLNFILYEKHTGWGDRKSGFTWIIKSFAPSGIQSPPVKAELWCPWLLHHITRYVYNNVCPSEILFSRGRYYGLVSYSLTLYPEWEFLIKICFMVGKGNCHQQEAQLKIAQLCEVNVYKSL